MDLRWNFISMDAPQSISTAMTHLKDVAVTAERLSANCVSLTAPASHTNVLPLPPTKSGVGVPHVRRRSTTPRTVIFPEVPSGHPVIMALVEGSNCNDVARESLSFGPFINRRPTWKSILDNTETWRIKDRRVWSTTRLPLPPIVHPLKLAPLRRSCIRLQVGA